MLRICPYIRRALTEIYRQEAFSGTPEHSERSVGHSKQECQQCVLLQTLKKLSTNGKTLFRTALLQTLPYTYGTTAIQLR
jgi:hypothetical protein